MLLKVKAEKLYLCFSTIPNLTKTTYQFLEWPVAVGWGAEPVFVSMYLLSICENHREASVCRSILCICVHGRRLVYVDISMYTRVCPISWAQSTIFAKSFGVCCSGKRNLPPARIST